ncbi:MAG: hypothetical protein Q7S23_03675, partial [bacterium]|nr:hypothetical protein [bacterium]
AAAVALAFPALFYAQQQSVYGHAFLPLLAGSGIAWVPPGWSVADAYARLPVEGFDYPVVHLAWSNPSHWAALFALLIPSVFGLFGYMDIWLPLEWYIFFLAGVMLCLAGWCGRRPLAPEGAPASRSWLFAGTAVALAALSAAVVRHNFSVIFQPQGRYLLALAVPGVLWLAAGWSRARFISVKFKTELGASFVVLAVWGGCLTFWQLVRWYV